MDLRTRLEHTLGTAYSIDRELSGGGMSHVFVAEERAFGRRVVVKVLRADLTEGVSAERFKREISMAAKLQHPHIVPLLTAGESGETLYYTMPFVDGETLRDRLIREGELPVPDVIRVMREVASALAYAHRRGIIHRDIKPENVLFSDGSAVVTDFGIAKALEVARTEGDARASTITQIGVALGTPAYMAPEQAAADPTIDHRADLYALGCVAYELLSGRPPFDGRAPQQLLAAHAAETPTPITVRRVNTPPELATIVMQCLEKRAADRPQSAGEILRALDRSGPRSTTAQTVEGAAPPLSSRHAQRNALLAWVFCAVAILALGTVAALWGRLRTQSRAPVFRFSVTPAVELVSHGIQGIALSPDGQHLVFPGRQSGVTQLYHQPIGKHDTRPIGGTEGASKPFFSPDGRWIGFFAGGKIKKVELTGSTSVPICDAPQMRGAVWGPDDVILFGGGGVFRVAASGGTPERITSIDSKQDEADHWMSDILPGGRAILFTIWTGGYSHPRIFVRSLKDGRHWPLLDGIDARFVSTGHIVFFRRGSLWAVRFDPDRLQLIGSPARVVEGVQVEWGVWPYFSFARNGTLAYVRGAADNAKHLVWVDRRGGVEPLGAPPRPYDNPALSPDESRVAVVVRDDNPDVWTYELNRGTSSRQTVDPGEDETPVWMPDGKRLVFAGNRHGTRTLLLKTVDEEAEQTLVPVPGGHRHASAISPTGEVVAFQDISQTSRGDIWMMRLQGDGKPWAFQSTAANEAAPRFSPDGHWLAYVSDEGLGRDEVYVRAYAGRDKQRASTQGGTEPVWARNGRELFYRNGDKMMVVDVTMQPTLSLSEPRTVFTGCYDPLPWGANYDITRDGQRFLMIRSVGDERCQGQINVELNWVEELKRRLPN